MSPALDTFARLQRTERVIAFIRLGVVAFNTLVYFWLAPHGDRYSIAVGITVVTWIYTIGVLIWRPEKRAFAGALPVVNTVLDNVLIAFWIWATGGFDSPWVALYYAEVTASVGRFGLVWGGVTAIGSALLYSGVLLIDGGVQWYEVVVRIGYMFVVVAFVGYVVEVSRGSERSAAEVESEMEIRNQLSQLKSTFISNVSHELRTPLTAIRGAATTLSSKTDKLDEPQRVALVDMIDRQSAQLGRLIQDLLDFSVVDRDGMGAEFKSLEVTVLVEQEIRRLRPVVAQQIVFVPLERHVKVRCDGEMIARAIRNIVENAAKFSPEKSAIQITMTEQSESVAIAIADQGIGIPEEEQERIFERFYQIDSSMTRTAQGAGVGLNIANEMVRLHGGTILVSSRPGKGSVFTIRLPMEAPELPSERKLRSA